MLPQLVYTESDTKAILYEDIIAILVEAMKEQQVAMERLSQEFLLYKQELEQRLTKGQKELSLLKTRLEKLEDKLINN